MKRLVLILMSIFFISTLSFGQTTTLTRQASFTSATNANSIGLIGTGIGVHRISWYVVNGTASACTVVLQKSVDNSTFSTASSHTCTSNGGSAFIEGIFNYVRINVSSLTITSGGNLTVTYHGHTLIPGDTSVEDSTAPTQILGTLPLFGGGIGTNINTNQVSGAGLLSIKNAAGIVQSLTIDTKASEAGSSIKCYDGTMHTVNKRIDVDTDANFGTFVYNLKFSTAINCVNVGSVQAVLIYK